jgi:tetratricopeptide (TPR) repeat protein
LKKKYGKCVSLLQNDKKLNDTLFLCYVGSLLETGQFERLTTDIKSRKNPTDAYFYYILGRIEFTRKNYAKADELFQEASVLNSFYPNHRFHSKYYAVKSRYAQYLEKPNIQNDSRMKQSIDDFLFNYCKGPSRPECSEVITIANTNR